MKQLFDFLIKKDVEYKIDQPMSQYTSVRIGGIARVIAFPDTKEKLVDLVRFLCENNIKHKLIGRMTNILPCDGEYRGILISTKRLDRCGRNASRVVAECGVLTSSLIMRMAKSGLGGAEGLCGIPGSLGGMIASNAGAFGCEIGDLVRAVCAYSCSEDRIFNFAHDEICFSYRKSIFSGANTVILAAELEFTPRTADIILEEMGKIRQKRSLTQPIEYPSLGSVFKKVNGISAAYLIDRCCLKGRSVGGAQVSPKHAGFIVNNGSATAADFIELVSIIKSEINRQCGFTLEEEIEYI